MPCRGIVGLTKQNPHVSDYRHEYGAEVGGKLPRDVTANLLKVAKAQLDELVLRKFPVNVACQLRG